MRGWVLGAALLAAGCQWVPGTDQNRIAQAEALLMRAVPGAEIHDTWSHSAVACGNYRDPGTGRIGIFFREDGQNIVTEPPPAFGSDVEAIKARTAVMLKATRLCYPAPA